MTDDFSSPKLLELLTLLLIAFHGSNVTPTHAEAAPPSPSSSQTDAGGIARVAHPVSRTNDGVVTLVEAPVEVVGPRAVESTMLEKVVTKRESGIGRGLREEGKDAPFFGVVNGHGRGVRVEDDDTNDDWEEDDNEPDYPIEDDGEDDDQEELEEEEEEKEQVEEEDADDEDDENDEDDSILKQKGNGRKGNPKVWDQWGRWSCCSATCGPGKYTRWRHCVAGGCVSGEKEAQMKSCKMNRCS